MGLTPLAEARRRAAGAAEMLRPGGTEVPLAAAHGALLAAPVHARQPIPHVGTSAMDGWAVRGSGPWHLLPEETDPDPEPDPDLDLGPGARGRAALSPADPRPALGEGQAVAVVTGSPLPAGTVSVLRSEHSRVERDDEGQTLLHADPRSGDVEPGRHLRPAGSEAAAGDLLLTPGQTLTPACLAMAAVAGHDTVTIHPLPAVRLVCTGQEVITSGLPGPGQVRDAFEISVPAAVGAMGGRMAGVHRVGDDAATLTRLLQEAVAEGIGLVLTTGGTAASEADALRPALQALGAETLVDSVDMRPGHPAVLARVGRTLVLGLPGNPLAGFAALAALGQVVLDALRGIPGAAAVALRRDVAALPLQGARRGLRLLPAEVRGDGVRPVGHDKPHMMRGFASADAFALVPAEGLDAGAAVDVLPLAWHAGSTPLGRRSSSWDD